jgi:hypothetical protein
MDCRLQKRRNAGKQIATGLAGWLVALLMACCAFPVRALTLAELQADPDLTPERFIKYFADFKFELGRSVRSYDAFLASQSGDCDDFATLAAEVLRKKGYTTRLVVVYLPAETHVVCYVAETGSYLDYNNRKFPSPLVKCDADLAAIGASVARSFRSQWRSVSEFTLENGSRRFLLTEFR